MEEGRWLTVSHGGGEVADCVTATGRSCDRELEQGDRVSADRAEGHNEQEQEAECVYRR